MESMLQEYRKVDTIQADPRALLCKFLRQELSHLDAVIRFNIDRRNKIERELRDLEAQS